jgi:hypothetical protein
MELLGCDLEVMVEEKVFLDLGFVLSVADQMVAFILISVFEYQTKRSPISVFCLGAHPRSWNSSSRHQAFEPSSLFKPVIGDPSD